ncbi:MAG: hypothetical protein GF398_15870 [Chitinivibrionales bacterium]|nr:hypothetical protein [Chitinivibrionales bacterium]
MHDDLSDLAGFTAVKKKLSVKEYIEHVKKVEKLRAQRKVIFFVFLVLAFLVFTTFIIILLQGFSVMGFCLTETLLTWLGAQTIGQIACLAGIICKWLFGK